MLIRDIGSAEFIYGAIYEPEEYGTSDVRFIVGCKHDKTPFVRNDVFVNFSKERPGLWRNALSFSCYTMQAIVFLHGLRRRGNVDPNTFSNGFFDIPSGIALEPAEQLIDVRVEIQCVPIV